jgi:hypothetical protein
MVFPPGENPCYNSVKRLLFIGETQHFLYEKQQRRLASEKLSTNIDKASQALGIVPKKMYSC